MYIDRELSTKILQANTLQEVDVLRSNEMLWIVSNLLAYVIENDKHDVLKDLLDNNRGDPLLLRTLLRVCTPEEDTCFKHVVIRGEIGLKNPLMRLIRDPLNYIEGLQTDGAVVTPNQVTETKYVCEDILRIHPSTVCDLLFQFTEAGTDILSKGHPMMFMWSTEKMFTSMLRPCDVGCIPFRRRSVLEDITSGSISILQTSLKLLRYYFNFKDLTHLSGIIEENIRCVYRLDYHNHNVRQSMPTIACYWQHMNLYIISNHSDIFHLERDLTIPAYKPGLRYFEELLPTGSLIDLLFWSLTGLIKTHSEIVTCPGFPGLLSHLMDAVLLLSAYGSRITTIGIHYLIVLLHFDAVTFEPLLDAYFQMLNTNSRSSCLEMLSKDQKIQCLLEHQTPVPSLQQLTRIHILALLGRRDVICRVRDLPLPDCLKLYLLPYLNRTCYGRDPLQLEINLCQ